MAGIKRCNIRKLTQDYVEKYFRDLGCELLSTYSLSYEKMEYRCRCGLLHQIDWKHFFRGHTRCTKCRIESRTGPNGPRWIEDSRKIRIKYCQNAIRTTKQIGMEPNGSLNSSQELFGYSYDEFERYIRSCLTCDIEKDKWEIDHHFPVWAFVDCGIKDLKLINSFENIFPGSRVENRNKAFKFNPIKFVRWLESKGVA